jgi:hypothetical protein
MSATLWLPTFCRAENDARREDESPPRARNARDAAFAPAMRPAELAMNETLTVPIADMGYPFLRNRFI